MAQKKYSTKTEVYNSFHLDVWDCHQLRIQESWNPKGIPVVYIHGWPWARSKPEHRNIFDSDKYRIIQFDQRWCWESRYIEQLKKNTTDEIVNDIEKVRTNLWVSKRVVVWNSRWSWIALIYGSRYSPYISSLVSLSTWIWNTEGFDYFTNNPTLESFYPEVFQELQSMIWTTSIKSALQDCVKTDFEELNQTKLKTLKILMKIEYLSYKYIDETVEDDEWNITYDDYVWMKFLSHFIEHEIKSPQFVQTVVEWLSWTKCMFVHGRYDTCSPLWNIYPVIQSINTSKLYIVEDAAHRLWDRWNFLMSKQVLDELV
jgi:proline iminopeptidase